NTVQHLADPSVAALPPSLRNKILFGTLLPAGYGLQLILDDGGRAIASSQALPPGTWSFAERDYFLVHRENPHAGLFVSHPFRSPLDDRPSIALSRRYANPDGSFGGIVVVTIELAMLNELFSAIEFGPASSVNLILTDGT